MLELNEGFVSPTHREVHGKDDLAGLARGPLLEGVSVEELEVAFTQDDGMS